MWSVCDGSIWSVSSRRGLQYEAGLLLDITGLSCIAARTNGIHDL